MSSPPELTSERREALLSGRVPCLSNAALASAFGESVRLLNSGAGASTAQPELMPEELPSFIAAGGQLRILALHTVRSLAKAVSEG